MVSSVTVPSNATSFCCPISTLLRGGYLREQETPTHRQGACRTAGSVRKLPTGAKFPRQMIGTCSRTVGVRIVGRRKPVEIRITGRVFPGS